MGNGALVNAVLDLEFWCCQGQRSTFAMVTLQWYSHSQYPTLCCQWLQRLDSVILPARVGALTAQVAEIAIYRCNNKAYNPCCICWYQVCLLVGFSPLPHSLHSDNVEVCLFSKEDSSKTKETLKSKDVAVKKVWLTKWWELFCKCYTENGSLMSMSEWWPLHQMTKSVSASSLCYVLGQFVYDKLS